MCVYGFESSCSPRDVSRLLWRNLRHGGQLHLVSATYHIADRFESYLKPLKVMSLLEAIGFEIRGNQMRDPDGIPVEDDRARVQVHAPRRIWSSEGPDRSYTRLLQLATWAMPTISTRAFLGNVFTATVPRAGAGSVIADPYTSFTLPKSSMDAR